MLVLSVRRGDGHAVTSCEKNSSRTSAACEGSRDGKTRASDRRYAKLSASSRSNHDRATWIPIVVATTIFSALSIWAARASDGFLEADACTHYMYARFALSEVHYFVNVWGRPFVTARLLPAAIGGRAAVRMTTLVVALAIAFIAYRIAKNQKYRWPALAFVFTLAPAAGVLAFIRRAHGIAVRVAGGPRVLGVSKTAMGLDGDLGSLAPRLGRKVSRSSCSRGSLCSHIGDGGGSSSADAAFDLAADRMEFVRQANV